MCRGDSRPARAIEDLQLQVGNGGFEDMPDDILRPEGAINKTEQGRAPCLDGIDRRTVAVDRLIDEEAGLIGALALLHEDHLAGHRRLARIAGAFHRHPPDRLGEHVVTKRAPVGGREGLEVNDGAENRAIAGGMNRVIGKALGPDLRLVARPFGRIDRQRETHPEDAWPGLLEPELPQFRAPPSPPPVGARKLGAALRFLERARM